MTTHCHHLFFLCNTTQKKTTTHGYHLLLLKHKEEKTHKKTTIKNQEKGRSLPLNSCSTLSLLTSAFTFLFQMLSLGIFFFSSKRKEKKTNKRKP
jgi:hypothetical protein